jgi:hypothetical protein
MSEEFGEQEDSRHYQLTTLQGWRFFVDDVPDVPVLLPVAEWRRLDERARDQYDGRRANHHARLVVVNTTTVSKITTEGRRLGFLNRNADYGRSGLIVSGDPRTGKTTGITQMAKALELAQRRRSPWATDLIPVVYITTPPAATPRMLAMEFARFLGLPIAARANLTDIVDSVCGVLIDARTSVVLVDEVHNISVVTRQGAEVSDTLKYFSERIPATFVYAGIGVERTLLAGARGGQIAGRFSLVATKRMPRNDEWRAVIATLEDSLRLYEHEEGALLDLEAYIHKRTGGMIGSLFRLIRIAGVDAVLSGSEKITRKSLAAIQLDFAAESANGS